MESVIIFCYSICVYVWIKNNTWWRVIKISKVLRSRNVIQFGAHIFFMPSQVRIFLAPAISRERKLKYRHDEATTRESTEEQLVTFSWQRAVIWKIHFRTCCEITNSTVLTLAVFFIAAFSVCRRKKKKEKEKEREKISPWFGLNRAFPISFTSKTRRRGWQNKYENSFKTCGVLFFLSESVSRNSFALHAMHVETFLGESRQSSMLSMLLQSDRRNWSFRTLGLWTRRLSLLAQFRALYVYADFYRATA